MIKGVVKFFIVGSVSVGLMSVVVGSKAKNAPLSKPHYLYTSVPVLNPDSPIVTKDDLPFKFNDNNGAQPNYDDKSGLYLENPSNIKTETNYNPQTGNYDISQKIGDMNYRPETYVEFQDYQDELFKQAVKNHWKSKIKAEDLQNQSKKGTLPKLTVGGEIFDRIFGGNQVDIKPTGTAELIFALNRNKTLNPAIPQRQQKVTNFDFNMRIQLNLIGKIGDKLKITTSYNTEASFDWENQMKLEYTGYEDEIIKKIEAGNVSMPLNSTLIQGSQSLFGVKTQLQFGRLTATALFSQQRGKKQEVSVQGGAQTMYFNVNADNYEVNKHYFLGHYFRDNYDQWMGTLPVVTTPIIITKVEVYITNQTGSTEQVRSIAAFTDLGEDSTHVNPALRGALCPKPGFDIYDSLGQQPHNGANSLYHILTNTISANQIMPARSNASASLIYSALVSSSIAPNNCNNNNSFLQSARDFEVAQNCRRLNASEFTYNSRLGFISINQSINNDQTVAVAYQYTYNGKVYQVGEFSDQYTSGPLYLKLLKSGSVTSPKFSTWDLMMKNVYSLGAYNLNAADFKCDIYYNNIETGVDIPYIPYGSVNGKLLVQVMGLDKLSVNGDPYSDGVYDFIKDYTINPNNGRIYLSTKEPFGNNLRSKFDAGDFPTANKYIFQELYDSTRTTAQQLPEKNRFKIKGQYKSASGSEISLNALNIPQGAVAVTANGQKLTENVDYTVDYTLGRVKIINESILNSGANIKVSTESNSLFNVQQKSLFGTRLDFKVNKDLTLGGTLLHLNEKPTTQKVNIGDEPVSNTIWGTDYNYKTDVPFLTRLIDKIPLINTKEMSSIVTRGEFAQLLPGNAKAIGKDGNSYVDDFEGSISLIDLKSPSAWSLASIPQGQSSLFPEAVENDNIKAGLNRAQFNWYTIDPLFYGQTNTSTKPGNIPETTFSNNFMRQVLETELFPSKTPPNGQPVVMSVLDLAFYPGERGPYNYDVEPTGYSSGIIKTGNVGRLASPESRWGGIMRRLETNDFQAANIEYVQFWMMDPFNSDYNPGTYPDMDQNSLPSGEMYINLGNISEDIVKDGKMCYENGLPGKPGGASGNLPTIESNIGRVPLISPISNSFVNDPADRPYQDAGYDGLVDSAEIRKFPQFISALSGYSGPDVQTALNDPSSDQYHFFRGSDYDGLSNSDGNTLRRYKKYNNAEGNSPTESQYPDAGIPSSATNNPNIEDINKDNTLSETENYYQYRINISPQDLNPNNVGHNFIVNVLDGSATIGSTQKNVKWYQFKVPVTEFEKSVGSIEGFNSIRFMRVVMKGFDKPVVCRIARMELVRSDWRRYAFDLQKPGEYIANDDNTTTFDVSAVSLQENGSKVPVNYVIPPGINQQQNIQTTNTVLLNEQALSLRACNLKDGDSRAITKSTELDVRSFGKLKLFMHAEKLGIEPLNDGDVTVFVRLGSDFNNNYYEYEVPVKLTQPGYYDPNSDGDRGNVWPTDNEFVIDFEKITSAKIKRNAAVGTDLSAMQKPFTQTDGSSNITVVGNPNLASIKSIMIGIRNPKDNGSLPKCVEVWVNELRLTDFVNKGGWATTGSVQAKLADLGQVSLSATYSKPFFGSIEKKISERNRETNFQWDATSTFQMGKFFPVKWKVNLPVYYAYGQTKITPQYSPYDPDIKIDNQNIPPELKKEIKKNAQDVTVRKGYNFSNVRIDGFKKDGAKPMPWDVSNFSVTYAYNETTRRNVNIEHSIIKSYRGALSYNYAITSKAWTPFKKTKSKILNNKWMALVKDINVTPLPSRVGFNIDLNRSYSELLNRDITSFYTGSSDNLTKPQFNKTFNMTRNYDLQWNFTKNLKFDFTANNDGRILEPFGKIDTKEEKDTIRKNIVGLGTTTGYRHQSNLNYQIPINKIPIFDFVNASAKYSTSYTWTRRPFAQESVGNTIQNTNTKSINGTFNMMTLYNKIPYFRKINIGGTKPKSNAKGGEKGNTAKADSAKKADPQSLKDIGEFLARGIMMIKQVSMSYQQTNGTGMPGFKPSSQYLGMDPSKNMAPGLGFVSGSNDSILRKSIENDWLIKNSNQSLPYTTTSTKNITYRANIEPHGSLKIELNGTKSFGRNESMFVRYDSTKLDNGNRGYLFETPNNTGNYSISVFTLGKSFKDKGNVKDGTSALFTEFLATRQDVAKELALANSTGIDDPLIGPDKKEYYDGYSNTQQDVLLGSFYQTYTGRKVKGVGTDKMFKQIPLPNWTVSWDGLGKLKFMKKFFQSVTLRHAYRSIYTIGGYANNLLFVDRDHDQYSESRVPVQNSVFGGVQQSANFNPKYTIQGATITESFSPLIKFDFKFNKPGLLANFEIKKDKTVNLNITGPQIIETKGQEYVIGVGYRIPNLVIKAITIKGQPLKSDLNFKLDLSYRRNMTIIRRIVDEISTPTGGQNIITLKTALDYQLTQAINLRFFYDWIRTTPQTSNSFPTANTNAGFSLRFNLQ
ncbi:MAG: cell surface protein SprA [Burkholderiales bacterium]|nr:cell surface protein SprA [Bacteroidia bacterium]